MPDPITSRDGVGRVVDRVEHAEERAVRLGVAGDADPDLRDDAERALAADDDPGQVVAGAVLSRAAGDHDRAVGQDHLDAEDVVDGYAVLEGVRAAGVGGDVAADRTRPLRTRVGGVVVAVRLQRVRQPDVDDARLDDGVAVADVHFQNLPQPGRGDHYPAADRHAAAGQRRARAAGHERHVELDAGFDHRDDLLGRFGKDNDVGRVLLDGEPVALVHGEFGPRGQDAVRPGDGLHSLDEPGDFVRGHRRQVVGVALRHRGGFGEGHWSSPGGGAVGTPDSTAGAASRVGRS